MTIFKPEDKVQAIDADGVEPPVPGVVDVVGDSYLSVRYENHYPPSDAFDLEEPHYRAWDNTQRLRLEARRDCPDEGTCHHACKPGACFRVAACGPPSGVYPGDVWPAEVRAAETPADDLVTPHPALD